MSRTLRGILNKSNYLMNNQLLLTLKPSLLVEFKKYLLFFIVLVLWAVFAPFCLNYHITKNITAFHFTSFFVLYTFFYCLWSIPKLIAIKYEIFSERILYTHGILKSLQDDIEYYRVTHYTVEKPLLLRLFGLSNIVIKTTESGDPVLTMYGIRDAYNVRDLIRDNVEQTRLAKRVVKIN